MSAPKYRLGGSTIAAACGIDPYLSRFRLSAIMGGYVPRPPESEAMRMGKRLEPVVREIAGEHGYPVLPAPDELLIHPGYAWAVGHPDGYAPVRGERGIA